MDLGTLGIFSYTEYLETMRKHVGQTKVLLGGLGVWGWVFYLFG